MRVRRIVGTVALIGPFLASVAVGQDMTDTTNEWVKHASVMVFRGTAVEGQKEGEWDGSGSGSFINRTGLVVTNNHVVDPGHGKSLPEKFQIRQTQNLPKYKVVVDSGTTSEKSYDAKVLYQNESADLAIVQVLDEDGQPFESPNFLRLFPTEKLQEGDALWCYGFPGGDKRKTSLDKHAPVNVSNGNIRGLQRSPGGRINLIETDVKAAPGSSGGPLVSVNGETMGILSQGGVTHKSGDGIAVRIIPADLVADMVKVGLALGKIPQNTDLEPFLHLFVGKSGQVALPGFERRTGTAVIGFRNGTETQAHLAQQDLEWTSPLGKLRIPTAYGAYIVSTDDVAHLLLAGGDRLLAQAADVALSYEVGSAPQQQSLENISRVAFPGGGSLPNAPDGEAILLEADGGSLLLSAVEGTVRVAADGGQPVDLRLDEIRRVEKKAFKQVIHTTDGRTFTGHFEPHLLKARLARIDTPIEGLTLEKVRFATLEVVNPRAGRGHSLADQLDIRDQQVKEIAELLTDGKLAKAGKLLDEKADRNLTKKLDKKLQDGFRALQAEHLLLTGKYAEAREAFKKLRSAREPAVQWFGASRFELLSRYENGLYNGEPLSDPRTFGRAARAMASEYLEEARRTLDARENPDLKNHREWKGLIKRLEDHEKQLWLANGLVPGPGESEVYRIWRFQEVLTLKAYEVLNDEQKEANRDIQDFRPDGSSDARQRRETLQNQLERLERNSKEIQRHYEDLREKMGSADFRLDDPEAARILDW